MTGRFLASGGNRYEHFAKPANGGDGPGVSLRADCRFHLTCESVWRRSVAISRAAKNIADELYRDFDRGIRSGEGRCMRWHGSWFRPIELLRLRLFAAQFEFQPPAMRRVPRFAPEFERADLGETRPDTHNQVQLA